MLNLRMTVPNTNLPYTINIGVLAVGLTFSAKLLRPAFSFIVTMLSLRYQPLAV